MRPAGPFRPAWTSLLTQVCALTFAALVALVTVLWATTQSTLPDALFRQGLATTGPRLAELVALVEQTPAHTDAALSVFSGPFRNARIDSHFPPGARDNPVLVAALRASDPDAFADRMLRFHAGPTLDARGDILQPGIARYAVEIDIGLDDGRVLRTAFAPASFIITRPTVTIGFVVLAVVLVGTAAALALLRALRPLKRLEDAAQALGEQLTTTRVEEVGPRELRQLARTFNTMQDRIATLVGDRTRTFTALAHDLRTGLTRLQLRLEDGGAEALSAAGADLDQLARLAEDMLLYARSAHAGERRELTDAVALTRDWATARDLPIADDAARAPCWIVADPVALRRVLDNLGDNAVRYGDDVSCAICVDERGLQLCVLDRGPGIDAADAERLFDPFERGETSRNRDTGGSGLGLGIARELMRAIGGDVTLAGRAGGGTCASATVPAALLVD